MSRKVRLRVLGHGWFSYGDGGGRIPAGTEVVFTEAEAAALLKDRRNRRSAEVIDILDDSDDGAAAAKLGHAPRDHLDEQSPAS